MFYVTINYVVTFNARFFMHWYFMSLWQLWRIVVFDVANFCVCVNNCIELDRKLIKRLRFFVSWHFTTRLFMPWHSMSRSTISVCCDVLIYDFMCQVMWKHNWKIDFFKQCICSWGDGTVHVVCFKDWTVLELIISPPTFAPCAWINHNLWSLFKGQFSARTAQISKPAAFGEKRSDS